VGSKVSDYVPGRRILATPSERYEWSAGLLCDTENCMIAYGNYL
jgi:hypothetical protein